jgi:hypothetical protein
MQPHQERVIAELNDLNEKRDKLATFLLGGIFKTLDKAEQKRLEAQAKIMQQYADILRERIANFQEATK